MWSELFLALVAIGNTMGQQQQPVTTSTTLPKPDLYTALVQVNVRCVNDPINGLVCAAEYPDKCSEQWNFPNPCTQLNIDRNITKFVHPFDKTKFLMCGELGKLYVVQCPQYEMFHEGCGQCVGEVAGLSASCEVPLPPVIDNPCTREAILANKLFFPFPRNLSMFIHCDIWGKPWERICTPGEVWSQWDVTCVLPHLLNPCNRPTTDLNYLYKHPCHPRMYLQCDSQGRPHEVICSARRAFDELSQQCLPYPRFPPNTDFTSYCEDVIFGFRTFHGNEGTPLPQENTVIDQGIGQGTGFVDIRNPANQGGGKAEPTSWQDIRNAANAGQGGNVVNWQDVRTQPGTGFVDIRSPSGQNTQPGTNGVQAGQSTNWQDIRSQTNQNTQSGTGFVDIRSPSGQNTQPGTDGVQAGQSTNWQDIRSQTNQNTQPGTGFVDIRSPSGQNTQPGTDGVQAGQSTNWQDIRSQTNQNTQPGTNAGFVDIRSTVQDAAATTGVPVGQSTNWQDIRSQAGQNTQPGTNAGFVDIRSTVQDAATAAGAQVGQSTNWQDIRSQTGNGVANPGSTVVDAVKETVLSVDVSASQPGTGQVTNGALNGGFLDATNAQSGSGQTSWQDIRSNVNANAGLSSGFVDAGTNQVDATNTGVAPTLPGTGTGGDRTMQQLLSTWNRIISSGGTAAANGGKQQTTNNNFGTNPSLSNNLGGNGNMGSNQVNNQVGIGKKMHQSQLKEYEYSVIPFSEPCIQINLDEGRTHFRLKGEPHKFLQCDANGRMHRMPCSTVGRDWFDVYTNTCVDGPVHLPV